MYSPDYIKRFKEGHGIKNEVKDLGEYAELVNGINEKLKEFNYYQEPNVTIANVFYIAYVKEKSPFKVRNLCAVINFSADVKDIKRAKVLLDTIRRSLLNQYGEAFLWKELEIIYVILAEENLFNVLKSDDGKVVDESGFTLNSLLGSFFINRKSNDAFSHSSWGVYFSGKHFKELQKALENWCAQKKASTAG